jgi:hypothetical protein
MDVSIFCMSPMSADYEVDRYFMPLKLKMENKLIEVTEWSSGGLNSGLLTCEASTLPLSYHPSYCLTKFTLVIKSKSL